MPPDVARGFKVGTMKIDGDAQLKRYEKSYAKMVQFVGIMYKAGVPIVAGTDDIPGFTLHSELALLVKAGLTPAQALQVATRNGARYTRTSNDRGSIAVGKLADIVLVDGDPTKNIEDVRKVSAVITRGYLIYPQEIDAALGIAPFVGAAPGVTRAAPAAVAYGGGNEGARERIEASARKHE
jgi:imidazolonepropionase-like amidohydrolase